MVTIPKHEYDALLALVASLTQEISELKAQLKKNSKNSNKPPSSDGPKKGAPKNNRVPTGRSSGGQRGHEGVTKNLAPDPEIIINLDPDKNCECGGEVIVQTDNYTVRQVTDIPPVKVITVEYRGRGGVCNQCGKIHKASFPENVKGTVNYGDGIKAAVTYLNNYQFLPLKRATELMKDLLGLKVSQGFIVAAATEAYDKLEDTEELQKEEIIESDVAHFDETGARVNCKNYWLHSAGTETCTVYFIHKKRGKEAMDEMGILPKFTGTAIHDHWMSYYHYLCAHGECNEHHLRTLKYLYEDLCETWAFEMACLLLRIKRHTELSKDFGVTGSLEQTDIEEYELMYRKILENAAVDIENRPVASKRMIKRLTKYEQETLLFMLDFDVPFTNNLAERDNRMPKLKQKTSGCFRSEGGAKVFARIRGFVSTTKKKGKDVLEGLIATFKGNAAEFLYPDSNQQKALP